MSEHACPVAGVKTLRVRRIADLTRQLENEDDSGEREMLSTRLQLDLDTIRNKRLCRECGYPLDNSQPHPDTRPW